MNRSIYNDRDTSTSTSVKLLTQVIHEMIGPFHSPNRIEFEQLEEYWNNRVPADFDFDDNQENDFLDFIANLSCKLLNEDFSIKVGIMIDIYRGIIIIGINLIMLI